MQITYCDHQKVDTFQIVFSWSSLHTMNISLSVTKSAAGFSARLHVSAERQKPTHSNDLPLLRDSSHSGGKGLWEITRKGFKSMFRTCFWFSAQKMQAYNYGVFVALSLVRVNQFEFVHQTIWLTTFSYNVLLKTHQIRQEPLPTYNYCSSSYVPEAPHRLCDTETSLCPSLAAITCLQ